MTFEIPRLTWRMVRLTGLQGGPMYTDLAQIGAVLDTAEPQAGGAEPQLAVARGATICLNSGVRFYVRETADSVFEEVRRYRQDQEPARPNMKLPDAAPAAEIGGPVAGIEP